MDPTDQGTLRARYWATGMGLMGLALVGCAGKQNVPPLSDVLIEEECDKRAAAVRQEYEERLARESAKMEQHPHEDAKALEEARAAYADAVGSMEEVTRFELKRVVLFGFAEDDVDSMNRRELEQIVGVLSQHPSYRIRVEGHTDDRPIGPHLQNKFPTNWKLSAARAATVARYIIDSLMVDPGRVQIVGFGKFRPVTDNTTEEGRARNRRVEIVIFKEPAPRVPIINVSP